MKTTLVLLFTLVLVACESVPFADKPSITVVKDPVTQKELTTTYTGAKAIDAKADKDLLDAHVRRSTNYATAMGNAKTAEAQISITAMNKLAPEPSLGMNSRSYRLAAKQENTKRLGILAPIAGQLYISNNAGDNKERGSINVLGNNNEIRAHTGIGDYHYQEQTAPFGGLPLGLSTITDGSFGGDGSCMVSLTCSCESFEEGTCAP